MRVELDWKEIKNEFDFTLLDYDDICFDEYQYQEAKKQADEYLKENKLGRISLIPLDRIQTPSAEDEKLLKKKGAVVERSNLAQQPGAFAGNASVRAELTAKGNSCLPLIMVDGAIAASGDYPTRQELAELAGVAYDPATDAVSSPAASFTLPMAEADACCPAPDNGSAIAADGEYCPWPRKIGGGCC